MSAGARDIKRRITSVKNTRQITKAMEMVSAAKMRRSQEAALRSRPYALKALKLLKNLSGAGENLKNSLLKKNETGKVAFVVISTDKGLCGGLNTNVFKKVLNYIKNNFSGGDMEFITVGKKAREWTKRMKFNLAADFTGFGDKVDIIEVLPLARILIKDFRDGKYSQVIFSYTNFISTLKQGSVVRTLLPIDKKILEEIVKEIIPEEGKFSKDKPVVREESAAIHGPSAVNNTEYVFEPSPAEILNNLLPKLIETQVYSMVLEANASEHSARMVAMKNASEAAKDMLLELALSFNKARQSAITQEIAEISAGRAALEQ